MSERKRGHYAGTSHGHEKHLSSLKKKGIVKKSGSKTKMATIYKMTGEKKGVNVKVSCDENNKPIEVLMAALATMPSLNVDELLKHYIEAKETTKEVAEKNEVLDRKGKNAKMLKSKPSDLVRRKVKTVDKRKSQRSSHKSKKTISISNTAGVKSTLQAAGEKVVKKPFDISERKMSVSKITPGVIYRPDAASANKAGVKRQPLKKVEKAMPMTALLGDKDKKTQVAPPNQKVVNQPPPAQTEHSNIRQSQPGSLKTALSLVAKTAGNVHKDEPKEVKETKEVKDSKEPKEIKEVKVTTHVKGQDEHVVIVQTATLAEPVKVLPEQESVPEEEDSKQDTIKAKKPGPDSIVGIYLKKQEQIEKEYQSVCQYVNRKRYNQLRLQADEAIRNETTFAICGHSNGYQTVRKYFQSRGWLERFANQDEKPLQYNNLVTAPDSETLVLSRLISRAPVKFIWAEGVINWANIGLNTMVNKFPYSSRSISTKTGLLQYLQGQHWTYSANFAYVKYPRTVSIGNEDDMKYFASHYRISACVCMLKHLVDAWDEKRDLVSDNGVIPIECIDFAIQRVCEFITFEEGTDVDHWNISMVTEDDWILYLLRFLDVAHFNAKYKNTCEYDIIKLIDCARKCITRVKEFWPDLDAEGVKNLWMVKPGASSCGRGIRIFKSLVEIANHCKPGFNYIAQKYIERPMIIHRTKFDIRQWFLVTSIQPMIVYMYDICYLRFCSKEFSLINLHESVHLSNNSVQCRYQNVTTRSGELPQDNMWDSDQFLSYLRGRKEDDKWFAITMPGMRKGIVGALLASQESMAHRANCFNLYGADFMLTEDFVPWLIEINAGPCLRGTTSVTARLCPMVIEDTISLVLKKKNANGMLDCGHFRLIYSQKLFPHGISQRNDLSVTGKRAKIFMNRNQQMSPSLPKRCQAPVMVKDSHEDANIPITYESRSLNYDRIADYKKHKDVEMKPSLAPHANHSVPLGPGSILSRFDVNYTPSGLVSNFNPIDQALLKGHDITGTFRSNPVEYGPTVPANNYTPPRPNYLRAGDTKKVDNTKKVAEADKNNKTHLPAVNLKVLTKKW